MCTNRKVVIALSLASIFASQSIFAGEPTVSLSVDIIGSGLVLSDRAGIDCPDQCEASFLKNKNIILEAIETNDQPFVGWIGGCLDTDPVCEIRVKASQNITAVFAEVLAPVEASAQTDTFRLGDDGDLEMGSSWPIPRFSSNEDGTIADHLTGLVWLQDAGCLGMGNWDEAIDAANALGSGDCGLSDGSFSGDWRLPNVKELLSLIDYQNSEPALPTNHPFLNVPFSRNWSSTSWASFPQRAWWVILSTGLSDGTNADSDKSNSIGYSLWAVRGG